MQVSKEEAIITTTTISKPTQITTQISQQLLRPKQDFLRLIQDFGSFGTSCGEVFTLKDLGNFLYQYIKKRELWDPYQPTVIHCEKDPLGRVFGVKTFTHAEAINLLLKNTFPVNSRKRRYTENERVNNNEDDNTSAKNEVTTADQISSTSSPGGSSSPASKRPSTPPQSSTVSNPPGSQVVDEINIVLGRKSPSLSHGSERKSPIDPQWGEARSPSSGSDRSRSANRGRQPTWSLVYDGNSKENTFASFFRRFQWFFRFELQSVPSSDSEDEVYSVQGKVTDVIQSSADDSDWSDDDDDDEGISTQERLSIEIGSIHTTDPPFEEEYEVLSDSGSSIEDPPFFPHQEFILVCKDSDKEFWADSESSDNDSDTSADLEIIDLEKWTCRNCENRNTPVRSRCDKCYEIRPGWVVEGRRYPYRGRFRRQQRQSQSVPNSPRPTSRPTSSSEIGSYSDHELIVPSPGRTFSVKSLFELAQFACNKRKLIPGYGGTKKETTSPAEQKGSGTAVNAALVISDQLSASDSESGSTDIINSSDEAETSGMVIRSKSLDPNFPQMKRLNQTSHTASPAKGGSTENDGTCTFCWDKPKDAILVHGKSGHQVCCYPCGQKLKRNAKSCPVCRRQIEKVIVNYQA